MLQAGRAEFMPLARSAGYSPFGKTGGTAMQIGRNVLGLGVIALATACFVYGDFDPGQPVPKTFPDLTTFVYVAATWMLAAGAAVEFKRTAAWGGLALAVYFGIVVWLIMNGRVLLAHPTEFVAYSGPAAQLAIAMAGLIVYAANARINDSTAARLVRAAQIVFGVCAILFGIAHFVYMNMTAPLVPKWLPPNGEFWGYLTGVAHIAAGVAIIARIQARLAGYLLALMYASFTPLVHIPLIMADPSRWNWSENAVNIALTGVAWVVADSFARAKPRVEA